MFKYTRPKSSIYAQTSRVEIAEYSEQRLRTFGAVTSQTTKPTNYPLDYQIEGPEVCVTACYSGPRSPPTARLMQPTPRNPDDARPSSPPSRRRQRVDSNPLLAPVSAPLAKRARSGDNAMSSKVAGKRAEVVDLTRRGGASSPFQPHGGAKKLVIKNLRQSAPSRAAEVERYYDRIWAELEAALGAIFAGRQPDQPLAALYKGVEDLCRHGKAEPLFVMVRTRCEEYLYRRVLEKIKTDAAGGDSVDMLRSVYQQWKRWSEQSNVIRSTFSYLDRSFLLTSKVHPQINDMSISLFRRMVFRNREGNETGSPPGVKVLVGMCQLVDHDRRNDNRFDATLLRESVSMLHVFNVYGKSFEGRFLEESRRYFAEFAEERSASNDLKDYIAACDKLLEREDYRCNAYNFDSTTKRQLLDDAHLLLVQNYSKKLLDSGSVAKLLQEHEVESMKALYELLRLSGIQKDLRKPWEEYIKSAGSAIVTDTTRGDEMVIRLLELRRSLDIMVRDAFGRNDDFIYGLREAFGFFINDKKIASSWNTGTSKVGEMIAKYIDMLLRGGLKTLPKELLSDDKDRATAEREGLSSTADEDAELDRQLEQGLELFRFVEGKDVFEAFYKRDLARRLLMSRSASRDAERSMLSKLKSECGSSFTHNLEQMFKDQELAKDEMASYREWKDGTGAAKSSLDLNVNILSAAAWPSYPDATLKLPDEVVEQIEQFDRYYQIKHTGRRLTWKNNLAHCVLKASFKKGPKELLVSAYQAAVLVLFNQVDEDQALSYDQISQSTALVDGELDRTLQSLACGRTRVLSKHPKGRDVGKTDTFTVNKAFTDPKYRVKINQIQLKETKEENQETHERVAADRQFETQAAIVRIMKSRKSLQHAQLVAEVINQTKSRGAMDPADIKQNIEKLIEKDYLEREGNAYVYLA
ncbi:uncharacterized protein E0L32_007260 [Thyridium curvatum]|uniref:Cullin family profile domain-containing protein n=1 Tax=Thyridium curvatum TaxID=1093900 RepID=A0A507AN19_9PEZI|nr:uncharacterized protein E0L32_007260 [Thyridium curvatum]TPX12145.1 hypothetical protein E0L32_007260 [Thyridium curvatum]